MKLLDYFDMIKILSVFLVFWTTYTAICQEWSGFQQLGGAANEHCEGLYASHDGYAYLAGNFEDSMDFNDTTISSYGEGDAFIAKYSPGGMPVWIRSGGGILDDQISGITIDQQGNLICIGSYWLEANFEHLTLASASSPKAIFVLKYNPQGDLLWAQSLEGTTLKEATDVITDAQGNIFISGFFKDQFHFGDTSLTAKGDSDLFVVRLSPSGEKEWIYSAGHKGDTRAVSLALTSEEDIILGGFYNDTTRLGNFELAANTYDRDVFLARLSQVGQVLWAKRAGGVHDDEIVKLALDESDQIYLTGYLVGVMNLNDQISIQSGNGNSDFYIIKYGPDGSVLQARAMGGTQVQQTTDIRLMDDQILVSGFYFGNMSIDGISLHATGIVSGFAGSFRKDDFQANWIKSIDGNQTVMVNQISVGENGQLLLAGVFSDVLFNESNLSSNGGFDLFFGPLPKIPTSAEDHSVENPTIKVYPNPAKTVLYIETNLRNYQVALISSEGRLVHSGQNLTQINIENLPKGLYHVIVNKPGVHLFENVVVE